ncbi:uncharacterized protein LOC129292494 isoform X2 [Prosopis cineraria]|uniref:uncharacterized protein LOC129292494 isoform X2 n=1 Tax=Prosopis cineraria TaxID=364024 RepID=UPI00240F1C3D|nr:uncharacterized protein LOC129292494 isoform X2 [Prosopis cineraria]
MAKFNVVQKKRRALLSEKKRQLHGDPNTGKLKNKYQPLSISGKRKRKLFKKWRREQKEALEKGLVTMEDVEMAVAEAEGGSQSQDSSKPSRKIHLKKSVKLKQVKHKGKNKRKPSVPAADVSGDAMVE